MQWAKMEGDAVAMDFVIFLEREYLLSRISQIGPSVFDGARRKVALRGEDYA